MERMRQRGAGRSTCPKCRAVFRRRLQYCPLDGTLLDPLPQDPLVGGTLGDRYSIEHVRSDGAVARTYAARDQRTGERCSVKIMYGDYASVDGHRDRFDREVELGAQLCHPNVLAVIDAGHTAAGVPYLVTAWVRGSTLATVVARHAPLGAERAMCLLADIAAGLGHMHEHGVAHRGVTGDAIVVTYDRDTEAAIITDLSTARTAAGNDDQRDDLRALGVVFYQLLSGRYPAVGGASAPNPARAAGLRVDPRVRGIAAKLIRNDPDTGFQSARDLLAVLEAPKLCSLS